jgi:hypothetical protein
VGGDYRAGSWRHSPAEFFGGFEMDRSDCPHSRTRLGGQCAPRIGLGRGSLARGGDLDEAQRCERSGLVGSGRQSHGGKCAPRIDLGRGSLARGSIFDWAQPIERSGLVGSDRQRGGARLDRREPRELFLGHASDARRLERDLRRHGAF